MPRIETLPNGKRVRVYDPSSPEDLKLMDEIHEKLKAEIKGQMEQEAEAELNKAEISKEFFEDMMQKLNDSYTLHNLKLPTIKTRADLESAVENLEEFKRLKENQKQPTGYAPLSQGQIYGTTKSEGEFNSQEELINHLRSEAHMGSVEAQKILDHLFLKALKGMKEDRKGIPEYVPEQHDESEIQRLNRNFREKRMKQRD